MTLYEFMVGASRASDEISWKVMHTDLTPLFGGAFIVILTVIAWSIVCYLYEKAKQRIRILLKLDPPPKPEEFNQYWPID